MNNQPWTQWTGKKIILPMRACYRCNNFFEVSEPSKKFCDHCSEYMMKNDIVPVSGSVGLNIQSLGHRLFRQAKFEPGGCDHLPEFIHHPDKATDCTRRFS